MFEFKKVIRCSLIYCLFATRAFSSEDVADEPATSVLETQTADKELSVSSNKKAPVKSDTTDDEDRGFKGFIRRSTGYGYSIEKETKEYEESLKKFTEESLQSRDELLEKRRKALADNGLEPEDRQYYDSSKAKSEAFGEYHKEISQINKDEHSALKECGFSGSKILEGLCETESSGIRRKFEASRRFAEAKYKSNLATIDQTVQRKVKRYADDVKTLEKCHNEAISDKREAYIAKKERIAARAQARLTLDGALDTTNKVLDAAGKTINAASSYYQYQSVRQKAELSRMKIDQECELRKERFYLDLHKSYFIAALETCDGDSKMAREIADAKLEKYKRNQSSWSCTIM